MKKEMIKANFIDDVYKLQEMLLHYQIGVGIALKNLEKHEFIGDVAQAESMRILQGLLDKYSVELSLEDVLTS